MPDIGVASASLSIKAAKLTVSLDKSPVAAGESRIDSAHWAKCSAACKGEVMLLATLKVTDLRAAGDKDEFVTKEQACPKCGEIRSKALDSTKAPRWLCLTCGLEYEVKG